MAQNVHEGKTKVKLLFLQGKVCKITTIFICRGFCRDPLPCSGFILYLHFAGGKAGAGPLLYKPYVVRTIWDHGFIGQEYRKIVDKSCGTCKLSAKNYVVVLSRLEIERDNAI